VSPIDFHSFDFWSSHAIFFHTFDLAGNADKCGKKKRPSKEKIIYKTNLTHFINWFNKALPIWNLLGSFIFYSINTLKAETSRGRKSES
jgi:hypothetical protein